MPDTREPVDANGPGGPPDHRDHEGEKVGDLLRKERVTRRITVETVAKDLKLNVAYIKALEANDYDRLPPDPYIRVYLRSLATYLTLDPEEVLRTFYNERGIKALTYEQERATRLTVTVKDRAPARTPWVIIAIILVALAIIGYVANKRGWIARPSQPKELQQHAPHGGIDEMDMDSLDEDLDDTTGMQPDAGAQEGKEESGGDETSQAPPPPGDSLRLMLSVVRDSVWIQAFYDGQSWRNFLYPKTPKILAAADSFNIHVGRNELMRYALDGRTLKIKDAGVATFKISRGGVDIWDLDRWNRVFKDRLK